ncbi:marvel domain-containing protein [Xylariaceae sp. FL0255]|nr:marvel domain-containing protein [Xylariaceae sp. FL0255]
MANMLAVVTRAAQLLLVLIATALIGNVRANSESASASATSAINFAIFAEVLAWLAVLFGLISGFVSALAIPIIAIAVDGATALFTLIAAIVLSAKLTAVNCANFGTKPADWIAFGSANDEKRCREIQGGVVFLWFIFITFSISLFLVFKEFRRGGGSLRNPSMSQIGV